MKETVGFLLICAAVVILVWPYPVKEMTGGMECVKIPQPTTEYTHYCKFRRVDSSAKERQ